MADQQTGVNAKGAKTPVGFTKGRKFLFFKIRSKPIYSGDSRPAPAQPPLAPQAPQVVQQQAQPAAARQSFAQQAKGAGSRAPGGKKRSAYITRIVVNKRGLQEALRDVGVKSEPYYFVRKMMAYAVITAVVIAGVVGYVFYRMGLNPAAVLVIAFAFAFAFYNMLFNRFVSYPLDRARRLGREIEKDILFATRDLVISMRSGMPLFNAMTAVSTGYGVASMEFAKVVSLIQLGMPIEQAMDDVSSRSQSKTFKRLMLQASVSIKVGADIIGSLQDVVQEIMDERAIELRRYGQRLNALAMFYMIFGVIFPSMGIAIATIMSTFISLFTITATDLAFVIVGIVGLQLIFLNIITSSRPGFSIE